jgi:hypothetical protein
MDRLYKLAATEKIFRYVGLGHTGPPILRRSVFAAAFADFDSDLKQN